MNLNECLDELLALTEALARAVDNDDPAACQEVLARRAEALLRLQQAGATATAAEMVVCGDRAATLRSRDAELQARCEMVLADLGRQMDQMRTAPADAEDASALCLDRRV